MSDGKKVEVTELFDRGLKVRREVLGAAYVDGGLSKPTIS